MLQTNYYIKSEKVISNTTLFGLCNRGCSYAFFSKADRDRHMRLMKLLFILKFK